MKNIEFRWQLSIFFVFGLQIDFETRNSSRMSNPLALINKKAKTSFLIFKSSEISFLSPKLISELLELKKLNSELLKSSELSFLRLQSSLSPLVELFTRGAQTSTSMIVYDYF